MATYRPTNPSGSATGRSAGQGLTGSEETRFRAGRGGGTYRYQTGKDSVNVFIDAGDESIKCLYVVTDQGTFVVAGGVNGGLEVASSTLLTATAGLWYDDGDNGIFSFAYNGAITRNTIKGEFISIATFTVPTGYTVMGCYVDYPSAYYVLLVAFGTTTTVDGKFVNPFRLIAVDVVDGVAAERVVATGNVRAYSYCYGVTTEGFWLQSGYWLVDGQYTCIGDLVALSRYLVSLDGIASEVQTLVQSETQTSASENPIGTFQVTQVPGDATGASYLAPDGNTYTLSATAIVNETRSADVPNPCYGISQNVPPTLHFEKTLTAYVADIPANLRYPPTPIYEVKNAAVNLVGSSESANGIDFADHPVLSKCFVATRKNALTASYKDASATIDYGTYQNTLVSETPLYDANTLQVFGVPIKIGNIMKVAHSESKGLTYLSTIGYNAGAFLRNKRDSLTNSTTASGYYDYYEAHVANFSSAYVYEFTNTATATCGTLNGTIPQEYNYPDWTILRHDDIFYGGSTVKVSETPGFSAPTITTEVNSDEIISPLVWFPGAAKSDAVYESLFTTSTKNQATNKYSITFDYTLYVGNTLLKSFSLSRSDCGASAFFYESIYALFDTYAWVSDCNTQLKRSTDKRGHVCAYKLKEPTDISIASTGRVWLNANATSWRYYLNTTPLPPAMGTRIELTAPVYIAASDILQKVDL